MRLKRIRWKDTASEQDKMVFEHLLYQKGGIARDQGDGSARIDWCMWPTAKQIIRVKNGWVTA